jgi:hypothetical protein
MRIAGLIAPLALGGEAATGNGTAVAVISAVSILGGYLLLAGLWYFVFRDKHVEDPPPDHQTRTQTPDPPEDSRATIQRRAGSRFRRR